MAETVNPPANTPAPPPPAPAAPAVAPSKPGAGSRFLKAAASLMTYTTFLALGFGVIFIAIFLKRGTFTIPTAVNTPIQQLFPYFLYFLTAFGLFFIAIACQMTAQKYADEKKINRHSIHAWKIPLIGLQAAFFYFSSIYAFSAGVGWAKPITGILALLFLSLIFLVYVLAYIMAFIINRLPSTANMQIALLTLALSGGACLLWISQQILPSLMVGLLAVIAFFSSLLFKAKDGLSVWDWPKLTCLAVSALLLGHVAFHAWPFSNPRAELIGLLSAASGVKGTVTSISYFQDEHKPDDIKMALSEKTTDGWMLQVLDMNQFRDSENNIAPSLPPFKVPAGDQDFRSIFVKNGNFLLVDKTKNGQRGLWKVNTTNGDSNFLKVGGIEPFEDGTPWSEKNGQLLYVTQSDGKYQLKIWTLTTGKSKAILSSGNPIHTPSWVNIEDPKSTPSWSKYDERIVYADGIHGLFYVFDLRTNSKELFKSDLEKMEGEKFAPEGAVVKVLPSPDNFRYLYVTKRGNKSIITVLRNDGTRRDPLYQTTANIGTIAWHSDSQQIIFEEKHETLWQNMDLGFIGNFTNIKLLDGNQGTVVNLIPAQISNHSPAVSPDGAKVAFSAGDGLWYPSMDQGIWVALLR